MCECAAVEAYTYARIGRRRKTGTCLASILTCWRSSGQHVFRYGIEWYHMVLFGIVYDGEGQNAERAFWLLAFHYGQYTCPLHFTISLWAILGCARSYSSILPGVEVGLSYSLWWPPNQLRSIGVAHPASPLSFAFCLYLCLVEDPRNTHTPTLTLRLAHDTATLHIRVSRAPTLSSETRDRSSRSYQ